jgi:hypothetical protein
LVALGGVEDEFAEEFAGGGVDDADVEVLDEHDDVGSGVGSADADGVEPALVAQGDLAGLVDAVAADAVVGVGVAVAGAGLGPAGVDRCGGGSVLEGTVWPPVVVLGAETVQPGLQFGDRGGLVGLAAEPLLEGLLELLRLAAGGGVVGPGVFWTTPSLRSSCSNPLRVPAPRCPRRGGW